MAKKAGSSVSEKRGVSFFEFFSSLVRGRLADGWRVVEGFDVFVKKNKAILILPIPTQMIYFFVVSYKDWENAIRQREDLKKFCFLISDKGAPLKQTIWNLGLYEWWKWNGWTVYGEPQGSGVFGFIAGIGLSEDEMNLQWVARQSILGEEVNQKIKALKRLLEDEEFFLTFAQCFYYRYGNKEIKDFSDLVLKYSEEEKKEIVERLFREYGKEKKRTIEEAIKKFQGVLQAIEQEYRFKKTHPYTVREPLPFGSKRLEFRNPYKEVKFKMEEEEIGFVLERPWRKGEAPTLKEILTGQAKRENFKERYTVDLYYLSLFLSLLRRRFFFTYPVFISKQAIYKADPEEFNKFIKTVIALCFWRFNCFAPELVGKTFIETFHDDLHNLLKKIYHTPTIDLEEKLISGPPLVFSLGLRIFYSKRRGGLTMDGLRFSVFKKKRSKKEKEGLVTQRKKYVWKMLQEIFASVEPIAKALPFFSSVETQIKDEKVVNDFLKKHYDYVRKRDLQEGRNFLTSKIDRIMGPRAGDEEEKKEIGKRLKQFYKNYLCNLFKHEFYKYCQQLGISKQNAYAKLKKQIGKVKGLELEELVKAMAEVCKSLEGKNLIPQADPPSSDPAPVCGEKEGSVELKAGFQSWETEVEDVCD